MKYYLIILTIIVFLSKTGNVLSSEGIFTVNNIEVNTKNLRNNNGYLNQAFTKGFDRLIKRALLIEDYEKVKNLPIGSIKKLISHYQILKDDKNLTTSTVIINIFFDKSRINDFFYKKNISYSNITKENLILFPLLVKKNNFYVYNGNFFFKNWEKYNSENELIEYILPLENLENIKIIENNINNLANIDILKLVPEYESRNYSFFVAEETNDKISILIKCLISKKVILKNFVVEKNSFTEEELYIKIILEVKKQILEIIKSQNIVDLKTPSFLNANLKLRTPSDLLNLQVVLKKIELIEKFIVMELNKNEVKIKIKYYGKLNNISQKLIDNGIKIFEKNNQWKFEIL